MQEVLIGIPLVLLIGCIAFFGMKYFYKKKLHVLQSKKNAIIAGVCAGISMLVLFFVPASIHQVEAGEVAVVKVWGEAKGVKTPGLHFDFWISHQYEIYDAKVQQVIIKTQTYSSDGQTMDVELVVQYQIQADKALHIAQNYGGLEMLESRISTVSTEKMKSVMSVRTAMNTIENRSKISPEVEESIREAITTDYYVSILTVVLTDISFTNEFEKTVEDKMIAEQEKLKAEYEKEKAIIQAEQELEVMRLNAAAKIVEAEGSAAAIKLIADAEAYKVKIKAVEFARAAGFTIIETEVKGSEKDEDGNDIIIGMEYEIDFGGKTAPEIKVITDYITYIAYLEIWNGQLPTVIADGSASIIIPNP